MILLHVLISIAGIVTGLVVLLGLIAGKRMNTWTAAALATNIATSLTGYAIPTDRLLPSHIVGVLALLALSAAVAARYRFGMLGAWRTTYVISTAVAVYLNVFVGVVQAFQKAPPLRALAPTQSEPPFAIAQGLVFLFFGVLTLAARTRFHEPKRLLARSTVSG